MSVIKEAIFSHAVAMHQAGRLKNTVYASDREIFILNIDKTVLLRFTLPSREPGISGEVSFMANDYDSEEFEERDGKIVFTQREGEYVRRKACSAPEKTFTEVQDLYLKFINESCDNTVVFNKSVLSLLDDSLSHIEILSENKECVIVQRDIYTGSFIRIDRESESGFGLATSDDIKKDFEPVGIRTNDFVALFSFCENVTFYFTDNPYALVAGDKLQMNGIVSGCLYDEMGTVTLSKGEK